MPGLDELSVSLTKNGYFKVTKVIEAVPADQVLANLGGQVDGVCLDETQIANMLSADNKNRLPEIWNEIRPLGQQAVKALVFIAVLFSHKDIISGFTASKTAEMQGILSRADLGDKAFTNLVDTMKKLELCTAKAGASEVPYNLAPLFRDLKIGPLAKRLLRLKLEKTGWHEPTATEIFYRSFYEQCFAYKFHDTLAISEQQFTDWLEGDVVEFEVPPVVALKEADVTVSATLVSALAAKPFVIMSGPTGTGKTMTSRQLAASLAPSGVKDSFNHVFIPVEAGWTDGRHLLGYKNPFGKGGETYSSTPLLELLLKANFPAYSQIPFFIILDEMNLSNVEMYFSRFLSLMETSLCKPESLLGSYELDLLHSASMCDPMLAAYTKAAVKNGGIFLTPNVFIIGTVNVDETTHMFSPKVLDRAFVLECPTVTPSKVDDLFTIHPDDQVIINPKELGKFLMEGRTSAHDRSLDAHFDLIYSALGKHGFGPRVTNECRSYVTTCKKLEVAGKVIPSFAAAEATLDRMGMQKWLPKLHGNRAQILATLEGLGKHFKANNMPQSAGKVDAMIDTLKGLGFTNYFA